MNGSNWRECISFFSMRISLIIGTATVCLLCGRASNTSLSKHLQIYSQIRIIDLCSSIQSFAVLIPSCVPSFLYFIYRNIMLIVHWECEIKFQYEAQNNDFEHFNVRSTKPQFICCAAYGVLFDSHVLISIYACMIVCVLSMNVSFPFLETTKVSSDNASIMSYEKDICK